MSSTVETLWQFVALWVVIFVCFALVSHFFAVFGVAFGFTGVSSEKSTYPSKMLINTVGVRILGQTWSNDSHRQRPGAIRHDAPSVNPRGALRTTLGRQWPLHAHRHPRQKRWCHWWPWRTIIPSESACGPARKAR